MPEEKVTKNATIWEEPETQSFLVNRHEYVIKLLYLFREETVLNAKMIER